MQTVQKSLEMEPGELDELTAILEKEGYSQSKSLKELDNKDCEYMQIPYRVFK
jgi:hypothetical protein